MIKEVCFDLQSISMQIITNYNQYINQLFLLNLILSIFFQFVAEISFAFYSKLFS